jgi:hypothetical protein
VQILVAGEALTESAPHVLAIANNSSWIGLAEHEGTTHRHLHRRFGPRKRRPQPSSSGWLSRLDEEALRVRHERARRLDLAVQCEQPIAVSLDGEAGHRPDHLRRKRSLLRCRRTTPKLSIHILAEWTP